MHLYILFISNINDILQTIKKTLKATLRYLKSNDSVLQQILIFRSLTIILIKKELNTNVLLEEVNRF